MERDEVHVLKTWLKRNCDVILGILAGVVLFSGLICCRYATGGKTFRCYVCEGLRYHAPCLIDLSTGEILELSVYEKDPVRQGELAEDQTAGHFSFVVSGGMTAAKDAGRSCVAFLPLETKEMNTVLFCENCKTAIADIQNQGVVLGDLYDLGNIQYFPVEKGTHYAFRDYQINMEETGSRQLRITVFGTR